MKQASSKIFQTVWDVSLVLTDDAGKSLTTGVLQSLGNASACLHF